MHRLPWVPAVTICCALLVAAFAAAPRACQGGLNVYAWCGLLAVVTLFTMAYAKGADIAPGVRALRGLGFAAMGAGAWVAWLFVAKVPIVCRLFQDGLPDPPGDAGVRLVTAMSAL